MTDREIQEIEDPNEIEVKHGNIQQIRIGFIQKGFSHLLGSGKQYDRVAWGAIGTLNPELAKTLLAEPRDGPYSGGYRVQVSAFRADSMDELYGKVKGWSEGMFSSKCIFIQEGEYKKFQIMVVTVLQCEEQKPYMIIGKKVVLKPAL